MPTVSSLTGAGLDWSAIVQAIMAVAIFVFALVQHLDSNALRRGRAASLIVATSRLATSVEQQLGLMIAHARKEPGTLDPVAVRRLVEMSLELFKEFDVADFPTADAMEQYLIVRAATAEALVSIDDILKGENSSYHADTLDMMREGLAGAVVELDWQLERLQKPFRTKCRDLGWRLFKSGRRPLLA